MSGGVSAQTGKTEDFFGDNNVFEGTDLDDDLRLFGNGNLVRSFDGADIVDITGNENVIAADKDMAQVNANFNPVLLFITGDENLAALGEGDNFIFVLSGNMNGVGAGDGWNEVTVTGNETEVVFGDGDNIISFKGNQNSATLGDGFNEITVTGNMNDVAAKDGFKNDITVTGDESKVEFGDGNNFVRFEGDQNSATLGEGTNTITVTAVNLKSPPANISIRNNRKWSRTLQWRAQELVAQHTAFSLFATECDS